MPLRDLDHPTSAGTRPERVRQGDARRRRRLHWSLEQCESRTLLAAPADFLIAITPAVFVDRPGTGTAVATFEVTLSPANIESEISVDFRTVNGTATSSGPNPDYLATSGTLTFPVASTSPLPIHVEVLAKTIDEPNKTFFVDLSNARLVPPDGQTVAIVDPRAVGTIVNTHLGGQVQFAAANYQVDESAGLAHVTITRTGGDASEAGAVFTTTTSGTAVPGVDFTPVTKTVTFGFNQSTATVDIPINTQIASSQDLTVGLLLKQPFGGATLGTPASATLTIHTINPLIVTTTANDGLGSLRYAINYADSPRAPANPTITFAIRDNGTIPYTIAPSTPLPAITRALTIDATTQDGYFQVPVVILSGAKLNDADGLVVEAGFTTITGLAINGFPGSAIVLDGAGSNWVVRNVLGADPTGRFAIPNGNNGLLINASSGNTVFENLISGNGNVGIQVFDVGATRNWIQNNTIGTDPSGVFSLPNGTDGVFIDGAPGNTIIGNLISGNGSVGVQVFNVGASQNLIQGNKIGTDTTGTVALPNGTDGVFLNGAPGNQVIGNLISGNRSVGVQVFGGAATGNRIQGNKIGTDVSGNVALPNVLDGVFLNSAPANTISSNLISGNGSVGVQVFGRASSSNVLQGNVIGLSSDNRRLGNNYGVFLNGTLSSISLTRNVIRGNRIAQVFKVLSTSSRAAAPRPVSRLSLPVPHKTHPGAHVRQRIPKAQAVFAAAATH